MFSVAICAIVARLCTWVDVKGGASGPGLGLGFLSASLGEPPQVYSPSERGAGGRRGPLSTSRQGLDVSVKTVAPLCSCVIQCSSGSPERMTLQDWISVSCRRG